MFVLAVFSIGVLTFAVAGPAQAVNVFPACSTGSNSSSTVCAGRNDSLTGFWARIINTLLVILGSVAVIMIIIGGIRYAVSNGDQAQITAAKNTILYSIVGIVVAIMAGAIVNFVISRL